MRLNKQHKISKKNIIVIPSKTIPQGISSILSFREDLSPEENSEIMTNAMSDVISAQVTYAVRDTNMNGKDIKIGDIIGLSGKNIVASGKEIETVTKDLISELIDDEHSIITLLCRSRCYRRKGRRIKRRTRRNI